MQDKRLEAAQLSRAKRTALIFVQRISHASSNRHQLSIVQLVIIDECNYLYSATVRQKICNDISYNIYYSTLTTGIAQL